MQKLLAIMVIVAMLITVFVGCGKKKASTNGSVSKPDTSTSSNTSSDNSFPSNMTPDDFWGNISVNVEPGHGNGSSSGSNTGSTSSSGTSTGSGSRPNGTGSSSNNSTGSSSGNNSTGSSSNNNSSANSSGTNSSGNSSSSTSLTAQPAIDAATGSWQMDDKGYFFVGEDGKVVKNRLIKNSAPDSGKIQGGLCFVGDDGYRVVNRSVKYGKKEYVIDVDGFVLEIWNDWVYIPDY